MHRFPVTWDNTCKKDTGDAYDSGKTKHTV